MTILSDLTSRKTNPSPPCLLTSASTSRVSAREGDDAFLLVLKGPGSGPILDISWAKGSRQLVGDRYHIGENNNSVHLTLQGITKDDEGEYTVTAKNIAGESRSAVYLRIKDGPFDEDDAPIFLRRLNDLAVKVGTRTRFLVEIRSSSDIKVTWNRNEVPIPEEDRFHFLHEGNFFCVDVAPVTVQDGGRWSCVAENRTGRSSCSCRLNVLVPKAYKAPEFLEELKAVLTNQGTVSLECKVVGVPTPVLKWYKDGKEIKPGDMFALTASPDDPTSLGMYTCEATNCMGKAFSSSRVHVSGKGSREGSLLPAEYRSTIGPPPQFNKELKDEKVKIGSGVTLSCQVAVPPWPRTINWYNKEGKIEPSEKYHIMEDGLGGYSIEIYPLDANDEGEWKCVATSDSGVISISKCLISMTYPKNYRKPKFLEGLKAILTEEGLVSFECKVVGFPTPRLQWFKDGEELRPGDVYQLTGTNSLGSYSCIARNCMGEARSTAELTVEDIQGQLNEEEKMHLFSKNQPPRFIRGLKSCEAKINEDFRFTVQVTLSPEANLFWYRDDEKIENGDRYSIVRENVGVCHLTVKKLEVNDQAEWKCVASNEFGQSITTGFLKLTIPKHYKKPKFLECLRAILSEEGAVNLECKVIGVPQPVLKWYKDGKELKPGDIHRIISGEDGKCCLGTYTCEARNCMGVASSSASLLGFEDRKAIKEVPKFVPEPLYPLAKNTSLSTIHEERTSQMYDTPATEHSITMDERGDVSFSFDGKEVSISLYETPDLTEEEALQVVEMYAEELSEHISEQNVVELPPMRFTKESSKSGPLLMEAVVIDVSEDYFSTAEDDLRTEADFEDVSMAEEGVHNLASPETENQEFFEKINSEFLEKALASLSGNEQPKKKRSSSDAKDQSDSFKSLSSPKKGSVKNSREKVASQQDDTASDSKAETFGSARGSSGLIKQDSDPSKKEEKTKKKKSRSRSASMETKSHSFDEKVEEGMVTITPKRSSLSRSSSGGSDDKSVQKKAKRKSITEDVAEAPRRRRTSRSASESMDETIIDNVKKRKSHSRSQSIDSEATETLVPSKKVKKKKASPTEGAKGKEESRKSLSRASSSDKDSVKGEKKRKVSASSVDSVGKEATVSAATEENAVVKKKKVRSRSSSVDKSKKDSERRKSLEKIKKMTSSETEAPAVVKVEEVKKKTDESLIVETSMKEIQGALAAVKEQVVGKSEAETGRNIVGESLQKLQKGLQAVEDELKMEEVSEEVLHELVKPVQNFEQGLRLTAEQKTEEGVWEMLSVVTYQLQQQLRTVTAKIADVTADSLATAITTLLEPVENVVASVSEAKKPKPESLSSVELLQNLAQPVQELQEVIESAREQHAVTSEVLSSLTEPVKNLLNVMTVVEKKAMLEADEEESVSEKILEKVSRPIAKINQELKAIENQIEMEEAKDLPQDSSEILETLSQPIQDLHRGLAEVVQEVLFCPTKEADSTVLRDVARFATEVINSLRSTTADEASGQEQRKIIFSSLETPLNALRDSVAVVKEILVPENLKEIPPEVVRSNVMQVLSKPLRDLQHCLQAIESDMSQIPAEMGVQVNKENILQIVKDMERGVIEVTESDKPATEMLASLLLPLKILRASLKEKKKLRHPLSKSSSSLGKSLDLIKQTSEDDRAGSEEMKINLSVLRPLEKPLQDLEEGFGSLEEHIMQKEGITLRERPIMERQLQTLLEILSQSFEVFQEKWVTIESNKEGNTSTLEANALLELVKDLKNGTETIQDHLIELETISPETKRIVQEKVNMRLKNLKRSITQVEDLVVQESLQVIPEFQMLTANIAKVQENIKELEVKEPETVKVLEQVLKPIVEVQSNLEKVKLEQVKETAKPVLDKMVEVTLNVFKSELEKTERNLPSEATSVSGPFHELKKAVENQITGETTVETLQPIAKSLEKFAKEIQVMGGPAVSDVLTNVISLIKVNVAAIDVLENQNTELAEPLKEPLLKLNEKLEEIKVAGNDEANIVVLENLVKPLNELKDNLQETVEPDVLKASITEMQKGIETIQQQTALQIEDAGMPEHTTKVLETLQEPFQELQKSLVKATEKIAESQYITVEFSNLQNAVEEALTHALPPGAVQALETLQEALENGEDVKTAITKVHSEIDTASPKEKKTLLKVKSQLESVEEILNTTEARISKKKKENVVENLESAVKDLQQGLENAVEAFKDEGKKLEILTVPLYELRKALEKEHTENMIQSAEVKHHLVELAQGLQEFEEVAENSQSMKVLVKPIKENMAAISNMTVLEEKTVELPELCKQVKALTAVLHGLQEAVEVAEGNLESEAVSLKLDSSFIKTIAQPIQELKHALAEVKEHVQLEKEDKLQASIVQTLAKPIQQLQMAVAVCEQQAMETSGVIPAIMIDQISQPIIQLNKGLAQIQQQVSLMSEAETIPMQKIVGSFAKPIQELVKDIAMVQEQLPVEPDVLSTSTKTDISVMKTLAKPIEELQNIIAVVQQSHIVEPEAESISSMKDTTIAKPLQNLQHALQQLQNVVLEGTTVAECINVVEAVANPIRELQHSFAAIQAHECVKGESATPAADLLLVEKLATPVQELATGLLVVQQQLAESGVSFYESKAEPSSLLVSLMKPEDLQKMIALVQEYQVIEPEAESISSLHDPTIAQPMQSLRQGLEQLQNVIMEATTAAECAPVLEAIAKPVHELEKRIASVLSHEQFHEETAAENKELEILKQLATPIQELATGLVIIEQQFIDSGLKTLPDMTVTETIGKINIQSPLEKPVIHEEAAFDAEGNTLSQITNLEEATMRSATLREANAIETEIVQHDEDLKTLKSLPAGEKTQIIQEESLQKDRATIHQAEVQEASPDTTDEKKQSTEETSNLKGIDTSSTTTESQEATSEYTETLSEVESIKSVSENEQELKKKDEEETKKEKEKEQTKEKSEVQDKKKKEEEDAKKKQEKEGAKKKKEEEEAKKEKEEEEAKIKAESEAKKNKEEEVAEKKKEEEVAKKKIEEEEAKVKTETDKKKKEEDESKVKAEAEAKKKKAEEEVKTKKEEDEAKKKKEEEEAKKKKEEEEAKKKKEEEEAKLKSEAEAKKKKEEDEAKKKKEEEEAKKKEEEEEAKVKAEAEARKKKEEEEAKKKKEEEELAKKKKEEEEAKKKKEEEAKKKKEEEEAKKKKEEEEAKLKSEAEAKKKKEEEESKKKKEEEEAKKKKEEEEAKKKKEEEEAKLKSEAEAKKKKEEEEAAKKKKEEEEAKKKKEEEEAKKKKEEEEAKRKREEEEAKKKKEEEEAKVKAEAEAKKKKEEDEAKKKKEEEEAKVKAEAEAKKKKKEEEAKIKAEAEAKKKKEEEEAKKKKEEEEDKKKKEEEEAKKKKEEEDKKKKEEEEAKLKAEAEAKKKKEEEKAKKKKEEEEAKKKKEEEEAKKKKEEEEAKKKKEEEEAKKKAEAEAKKKEEEEAKIKAEAEAKKKKEEAKKKKEEEEAKTKKEEEEAKKKKEEEEAQKKMEEEAKKKKEEEEAKKKKEEEEAKLKAEAEAKKKKEEEEAKKKKEEEEAKLKAEAEAKKKKEEEEAKKKKEEEEAKLKAEAEAKKKKEEEEGKKQKEEYEAKMREDEEAKKKKDGKDVEKKKSDAELEPDTKKDSVEKIDEQDKECMEVAKKAGSKKGKKRKETDTEEKLKSQDMDTKGKEEVRKTTDNVKNKMEDSETSEIKKKSDTLDMNEGEARRERRTGIDNKADEGRRVISEEDHVVRKIKTDVASEVDRGQAVRAKWKDAEERVRAKGRHREVLDTVKETEIDFADTQSRTRKREIQKGPTTAAAELTVKTRERDVSFGRRAASHELEASLRRAASPAPSTYVRGDYSRRTPAKEFRMEYDLLPDIGIKYKAKLESIAKQGWHPLHRPDYGRSLVDVRSYREQRKMHEITRRDLHRITGKDYSSSFDDLTLRLAGSEFAGKQGKEITRDKKGKPVFCSRLVDHTAPQGTSVKLTCTVLGTPEPSVKWLRHGIPLTISPGDRYRATIRDGIASLEIMGATKLDNGEYTCLAENDRGETSTSCKLRIFDSYDPAPFPPTFTTAVKESYKFTEDELILECRVRSHPPPKVQWLRNGVPLRPSPRYQQSETSDGICKLVISHPETDDSGDYSCRAENQVAEDSVAHRVKFLGRQHYADARKAATRSPKDFRKPHFRSELTDHLVPAGGTIALQVEVKGMPPPEVKWLRGNEELLRSSSKVRLFEDAGVHTLLVSNASETEAGIYSCHAYNAFGHIRTTAAVEVLPVATVRGGKPPKVVNKPKDIMVANVEDDMIITCRVTGDPKPRVSWMKGTKDITITHRTMVDHSDDYYRFTLKKVVPADAGTYWIIAKNVHGHDRAFVTLQVKQRARSLTPGGFSSSRWDWGASSTSSSEILSEIHDREKYNRKETPGPITSEPFVADSGRNWLTLSWKKPSNRGGAPVIAYRVDAWEIGQDGGARWTELGITPVNTFDAFKLKKGKEYKFRITPRNRYGWGEPLITSQPITVGFKGGNMPEFTKILPGQLKALYGSSIRLECHVTSDLKPIITWYRDGIPIDVSSPRLSSSFDGTVCHLVISDLVEEDSGRYMCEAVSKVGRVSTFARLMVVKDAKVWEADANLKRGVFDEEGILPESPPLFTMRLRDRRVQMTYPVRLTCQVIGSPDPEVKWYHDGKELTQDDCHTFTSEDHFHTLEMSKTNLEDAGCYTATARNEHGSVSCRCNLVVDKGIRAYVAPEFVHELEVTRVVRCGDELRLTAQVEAYPSVGVVWHRNGVRLRPSRRIIMTLNHEGLVELAIAGVTEKDSGVYTCTAANEVGRCETVCRVNVQSGQQAIPHIEDPNLPYSKAPMFIKKPRSSEAVEGDAVVIECQIVGDPKPEVFWLRDFLKPDYYRDAPLFRRLADGTNYCLEIPHVKLDHTGTYTVVARNIHGEVKAVTSLQIYAKGQGKEDRMDTTPVTHGNVENLPIFQKGLKHIRCCDGDAVTLECVVEGSPQLQIKWKKGGKPVPLGGDFSADFDGRIARLTINQVYPEDEGEYVCEASNSVGKTTSSACLVVDVPEEKENLLSRQLTRPPNLMSGCSTPRSTPRTTPSRSISPYPAGQRYRSTSPGSRPRRLKVQPPKFYAVPHNRIAQEGETVRFQCAIAGHPTPWVTWDKDGRIVTPTARITISEKEDLKILEISEVTAEDAGLYRITVENEVGRIEATARLEVIGHRAYEPKSHTVRAWSASPTFRRRLTSSVGRIGGNVTLACDIRSSPNPITSWYRNGELVVRTNRFTPTWNGETAMLEIENLQEEDGGVYTCVAENEAGKAECSTELVITDDGSSPSVPVFSEPLNDIVTEEGSSVELQARVQGDGPLEVVWSKDNKEIPDCEDFHYVDYGDGRFGLRIADAFVEDSGEYSCEVFNKFGDAISSARIWVKDCAPRIVFSKKPTSAVIACGQSVTFCARLEPTGSRTPDVFWTVAGREFHTGSTGKYTVEWDGGVSFLHIASADRGDAGRVTCTARFKCSLCEEKCECSDSSALCSAELTVVPNDRLVDSDCDKLKCCDFRGEIQAHTAANMSKGNNVENGLVGACITRGPADQHVYRGGSVVLNATYCGQPEPQVRWAKGGRQLADSDRIQITTGQGSTSLRIESISSDDSGKYVVSVENIHGSDRHFASLAVEGPPEPPSTRPTATALSSNSAIVEWSSPAFDGGCKITGYVVEVKTSKSDWKVTSVVCDSLSYVLKNLVQGEKYKFRIRAENIHGRSEPSLDSNELTLREIRNDSLLLAHPKIVTVEDGELFKAKYEVLEELGKGRFGIVHKVADTETGEKLAAKFIRCITVKDREKVKDEIAIMNCLRHPKLLQLAAAFESPREMVMVMEYISGGELFERVVADDFQLTERDCILFMRQICEGVNYMHDNSVVHLDLKPENIMCQTRTSHEIKLIDFGLAQKIDPENPVRVLFGTPEFVPPEVINYEPIGFESDMWSVGVICYVLLSGLSPFMGENDAETFANITRASYDFDEEAFRAISQDAKDFISSLLVKRKEKRLTASECLRNKWMLSEHDETMGVVLSTDKLKKFIIRRKWQKTGNAIRALGRLATLSAATRRNTVSNSSPSVTKPVLEEDPNQKSHACGNTSSPSEKQIRQNIACKVDDKAEIRSRVFSERSDSGISDCSSSSAGHVQSGVSLLSKKYSINETEESNSDSATIGKKVDIIRRKFANLSKNIDEMDKKLETVGRKLVDMGPGTLVQASKPEIRRVPSLKDSRPDLKRLLQPTASSQAKTTAPKSPVPTRAASPAGLTVPVAPELRTAKLSKLRQEMTNTSLSPTVRQKKPDGLKSEQRTPTLGNRFNSIRTKDTSSGASTKKEGIVGDLEVTAKENANIRNSTLSFQKAVAFWKSVT